MKKRALVLLFGLISNCFVFCQLSKDSPRQDSICLRSVNDFLSEESWQIHKEAYKKQLESQGLDGKEIKEILIEFDAKKSELIEKINLDRKHADIQRKQADILRQQTEDKTRHADVLRQQAEDQRNKAGLLKQEAEVQRKQADILSQKTEEQRKKGNMLRLEAEKQSKLAEEWRKSYKELFSDDFALSAESIRKTINIMVDKKNTLFFSVQSNISSGNVLIEIIDPNEKKEGTLTLEHQQKSDQKPDNATSNDTSGSLNKTINDPVTGNWSIRISTQKMDGNVYISAGQIIRQE